VTIGSLFATYRAQKHRRLLEALPTSATQGVFIGLVELKGSAESYPILKADDHFRTLQDELIETEQRLALARGYFNDIATEWNNRVEQFPDRILAKIFRWRRQDLFEAGDFERAATDVKFAE